MEIKNKPTNFRRLLAKIDHVLLTKILQENLVNILSLLLKIAKKIDEKVIFLIKAINIAMKISIFKIKLYIKFVQGFDKNYKNAQMRIKKLKKI